MNFTPSQCLRCFKFSIRARWRLTLRPLGTTSLSQSIPREYLTTSEKEFYAIVVTALFVSIDLQMPRPISTGYRGGINFDHPIFSRQFN